MVIVRGIGDYERIGKKIEDEMGEELEKKEKIIGMNYKGGKNVERMEIKGEKKSFEMKRKMKGEERMDF